MELASVKIFVGAGDRRETDLEKLRVPMPPKVEIVVQDFVGFIAEYASNISKGGMFIGTDAPHPTGTEIEFDIHLEEDKFSLIRGRGVVVWSRPSAEGGDRSPGMGVRFSSLEGDSASLIERIVENYIAEGGTPFELDRDAPAGPVRAPETPSPVEAPEPVVPAEPSPLRPQPPPQPQPVRDEARSDATPAEADQAAPRAERVEDDEARQAVRSLGHSDRGFAPGMEPAADLEGQEERARAPKPSIPGVDSADPAAETAAAAGESAPAPTGPPSMAGSPAPPVPSEMTPEAPTEVEPPAPLEATTPRAPTEVAPPAAIEASTPSAAGPSAGVAPAAPPGGPATEAASAPSAPEAPRLDEPDLTLEEGVELSLDPDEEDFSIDFDTTNSLESEKAAAHSVEAESISPPEASGDFAATFVEDEPTAVPDLSETLGQDMVGAGTGFFEAMKLEGTAGGDADLTLSEPDDQLEPEGEEERPSGLAGLEEEGSSGFEGLEEELDVGDTSSLEELVGELQIAEPEAELASDSAAESTVEDLELEALASLDSELSGEEIGVPSAEPLREAESQSRSPVEAPPVEHFVVPELEPSTPYVARPPKRRPWRTGQLRRWTILLLLLAGVGSGIYYVREKGVELFLGPGSDFVLVAQPLAESEELGEIEPSTLLELMQQEQKQVEIAELGGTRQRQVRPLSLIENVTWRETDRTTILTLWGNGDFAPSSTAYVRLDGETSREVLQIRGVDEPYWARSLGVGTRAVAGLRFGYRERKPFNEVHLAIDLERSQARVRRIELDGRRLHVYVR